MTPLRQVHQALVSYAEGQTFKGKEGYYLDHSRWHAEHGESGHPDPTVWFHGTYAHFNEFDPAHSDTSIEWNNHLGFHFAHSPRVANRFAAALSGKGRIIPVRLAIQNPFVFEHEDDMSTHLATTLDELGKFRGHTKWLTKEQNAEDVGYYKAHLKSQGYDGIVYPPYEGGIGAIPFDVSQIHEAYGHGDKTRRFSQE